MPKTKKSGEDSDFYVWAKKIVDSIRKKARWKTCGGCKFYRGAYCSYEWKCEFETHIETPDAIACSRWKAKPERKKK